MTTPARLDVAAIKARVDLVAVAGQRTPLKELRSGEYKGRCPFPDHDDTDPSFTVTPANQTWYCFGCQRGGDVFALLEMLDGLTFREAVQTVAADTALGRTPRLLKAGPDKPKRQTTPPPANAGQPSFEVRSWGRPVATWVYRDAAGGVLFYVARYDVRNDDGTVTKATPQWTWGAFPGQPAGWALGHYAAPRPLWQLDQLAARPDAHVLIVEGEKAAEAAQGLFPDHVVTTWAGGCPAVKAADWAALAGRRVTIWPDADAAGRKAADEISDRLAAFDTLAHVIPIEPTRPDGWDAADAVAEGWTPADAAAWLAAHTPAADAPPPADAPVRLWWTWLGLTQTERGPHANLDNVVRILTRHPATVGQFWTDTFHRRTFTTWDGDRREVHDADVLRLTVWLQAALGLPSLSTPTVDAAVQVVAARDERSEPAAWLRALVWDGRPRLDTWCARYLGAEATPYTEAVGRNFLTALVARLLSPGCKVDTMLILEGPQGIGKSTALQILGGAWFAEATEHVLSKDFYLALHGKAVIEVAELDAFSRAEVTRVKQILTATTDRYREPYARRAADVPRQCVFAGTTNEDTYLRDHTGARRFWPIRCTTIDTAALRADRAQLLAEAVARFDAGHDWWTMPTEDTAAEQAARRTVDEWETLVVRFLTERPVRDATGHVTTWEPRAYPTTETTVADVLRDAIGLPQDRWHQPEQTRVARILIGLGFRRVQVRMTGSMQRRWVYRLDRQSDGVGL